jgi:hypothetical protein
MRGKSLIAIVGGSLAFGTCAMSSALAFDQLADSARTQALDNVEAEYVRHNRAHRMAEIQWNLERQNRWRRHYGPPPGYGYGYRRHGPPPGYGYGRGYGYRGGYGYGAPGYNPALRGSTY